MLKRLAMFAFLLGVLIVPMLVGTGTASAAGSAQPQEATKFRDLPFSDVTDASQMDSVWYRFQPKADGLVTLDTFGSNYDTVLVVYTSSPGQSAQELTQIAWNDDSYSDSGFFQSIVQFQGTANTTYFIQVHAYPAPGLGWAGTLVLNAS